MIKTLHKFVSSKLAVGDFARNANISQSAMSNRLATEAMKLRKLKYVNLRKYVNDITASPKKMRLERTGWINAIKAHNKYQESIKIKN